jgi:acetyl/propionyl-CoA carboxylase alpha subunit
VDTILIADRGESAVRVARACRDAGLASVAVYADPAERAAVHVRAADRAVPLAGLTPAQTYLDPAQVLRAAVASEADALHSGYGPLAENAEFAQPACAGGGGRAGRVGGVHRRPAAAGRSVVPVEVRDPGTVRRQLPPAQRGPGLAAPG